MNILRSNFSFSLKFTSLPFSTQIFTNMNYQSLILISTSFVNRLWCWLQLRWISITFSIFFFFNIFVIFDEVFLVFAFKKERICLVARFLKKSFAQDLDIELRSKIFKILFFSHPTSWLKHSGGIFEAIFSIYSGFKASMCMPLFAFQSQKVHYSGLSIKFHNLPVYFHHLAWTLSWANLFTL